MRWTQDRRRSLTKPEFDRLGAFLPDRHVAALDD
jgi:hypothetical protein